MLPSYQRNYHTINMADINNKPKLQLRSGLSFNNGSEKSPSPATKLLINHGKPNFTIQRSPKVQNGNGNATDNGNPWGAKLSAPAPAPAAVPAPVKPEFVVRSTTFNGVFKPSNISKGSQQSLQQNAQEDNEAAKVVLRRAKVSEPSVKDGEDENVPEFIRRQRRIQERLAKENVLDFENRRSGYFTHVMISPSSPNRQSFVETMSSPAIVPALEIPPPTATTPTKQHEEDIEERSEEEEHAAAAATQELVAAVPVTLNGHEDEEEVNKAIEEVNKAVAGEEDEKTPVEEASVQSPKPVEHVEEVVDSAPVQVAVTSAALTPEDAVVVVATETVQQNGHQEPETTDTPQQAAVTSAPITENGVEEPVQNGHVEAVVTTAVVTSAPLADNDQVAPTTNGHVEEPKQNGSPANGHADENEVTISHTNALSTPSLPNPDPSGEKGVNYEPKTVVSFSKDLGSDVNKYPDTVKVAKDGDSPSAAIDDDLKELAKLKFEISTDNEVKPVLVVE